MKKIFISTLTVLAFLTANAQEPAAGRYLFPEFKHGIGKMRQGLPISDNFNYDVVKQEMHFLDGREEMLLDMPGLDTLYIDKRKFVQTNGKFAECIHLDNGIELQIFWHSKQQEKGRIGANGQTTTAGGVYNIYVGDAVGEHAYQDYQMDDINVYAYIPQNTYLAKVKNKNMKFTDAKSFAKAFKMDPAQVKSVMEENKWSFQKVSDVISLLNTMEFK